jgi:hypothetical protein
MNTTPDARRGFWSRLGIPGDGPAAHPRNGPRRDPTLRLAVEPFGPEHSGKTALQSCLFQGLLRRHMPSGLELTAADPRTLNLWFRETLERYRDLQVRGLASSLAPALIEYILFQADEPRVTLQWRDAVGQVFSHTTPESPEDQQARWDEAMAHVGRADVILPLIGCPPDGSPEELDRFELKQQHLADNLRRALAHRPPDQPPAALGIVVNKLSAGFASEAEAREALTAERLRSALPRLVHLAEHSARIGMAAIILVDAFGFDTVVPAAEEAAASGGGCSPLSEGEVEWLLKPGVQPAPFGLDGLAWWCTAAGLMLRPADDRRDELAALARRLDDDLRAIDAWVVPLDCQGTRGG